MVLGLGSVCRTGIGGCSSGVVSEVEKGLQALTRGSAGIVGAPHMGVNGRGLFLVLSDGRTGEGNGAREIPYEHKESFAVRAMGAVGLPREVVDFPSLEMPRMPCRDAHP